MVKRRTKIIITIALGLIIFLPMIISPRRMPRWILERYILWHTPYGTSFEDVVEFVSSRYSWRYTTDSERGLAPDRPNWRPPSPDEPLPPHSPFPFHIVGEMSIRAHLGTYRAVYGFFFLFIIDTSVFWAFDGDGNLIYVLVQKTSGP